MKIDSHQHYWHYNLQDYGWMGENMKAIKRDFLPCDLLTELKTSGFDGSVAVQARQNMEETNWLLKLADNYPHIKGVVGWLDLQSETVEADIQKFAAHQKAVGVRHVIHDEENDDFMLRPEFIRGVKLLEKYNLAYDILIFPKHLQNTLKYVQEFSVNQTFIIDHIAKPFIKDGILSPWKEELTVLAKFPNVYCKLSGMVTEADWKTWQPEHLKPYLDVVFEAFGTDRVMIGSDWPVCLAAGNYQQVMNVVIDYISNFKESGKAKILGENALKAYKIDNSKPSI